MATSRLSSKGQILLPAEFTVEDTPQGVLLRPVRPFPTTTLDQVAGCLKYKGKPKTLAEMDAGIARMVKLRHERGRY